MSTTHPIVKSWFHAPTFTATHCIVDPETRHCAILDSVLDFDYASGRTRTDFADVIADFVRTEGLTVDWLLESHAHADHLSAAPHLKKLFGGKIAIGEHIRDVQKVFSKVFNDATMPTDGSPFDHLFKDGETFAIGKLQGRVMHTPGHTPACVTYLVGDSAFVGDTLFMPDYGTARCDFPGGDAHVLYQSVHKLYSLPPDTKLYLCHDYMPGGREPLWQTTVQAERDGNIQLDANTGEDEFVAFRKQRDATLSMPALILPSVQVNVRAGELPKAEGNGVSYLKLPVNAL